MKIKEAINKSKKKSVKTNWKYATFDLNLTRKQRKEIEELRDIQERENNLTRKCLMEVAMFLDGFNIAKGGSSIFSEYHIRSVREAVSKFKP